VLRRLLLHTDTQESGNPALSEPGGVLEVRGLRAYYVLPDNSERAVIEGVDLSLGRGEAALVIGRSGSGKTTLARAICGLLDRLFNARVEGEVTVNGKTPRDPSFYDEVKLVGQNPYAYFVEHVVRHDLVGYASRFYGDSAEEIVRRRTEELGLSELLDRRFYELSGGEARMAAILKAVIRPPSLLVLDEPMMWVDDANAQKLVRLLKLLKGVGVALLIFEHRFAPLIGLQDKAFALRQGRLTALDRSALSGFWESSPPAPMGNSHSENRIGERLVAAEGIKFGYGSESLLDSVWLEVRGGELVVVIGPNGSGKSTLLKLLAGQLKPTRGKVFRKKGARAGYLPQNPLAFFTEPSLEAEVREVCRATRERARCEERVRKAIKSLGIEDLGKSPHSASWGELIRAALAILAFSGVYKLLLLDEPFTGLDYTDRCAVGRILSSIVKQSRGELAAIVAVSTSDSMLCLNASKTYALCRKRLEPIAPPTSSLRIWGVNERVSSIREGEGCQAC